MQIGVSLAPTSDNTSQVSRKYGIRGIHGPPRDGYGLLSSSSINARGLSAGFIDRKRKGIAMLILQLLGALITIVGLALLLTSGMRIARRAVDDSIEAKRAFERPRKLPQAY